MTDPTPEEAAEQAVNDLFGSNGLAGNAISMHALFTSFTDAGFTPDHALELVKHVMTFGMMMGLSQLGGTDGIQG